MASTNPSTERQFPDVYERIAGGWATASPGSIAAGAQATVSITVPGVVADGSWDVISESSTATNISGIVLSGNVSAANTVTLILFNGTAGAITPTAGAKYIVLAGRVNPRFFQ